MKRSIKRKNLLLLILIICLVLIVVLNIIGSAFHIPCLSVFAANSEAAKYQVRSELLMNAMNAVGVCRPEDAAKVWAEGLKARSAALQYSVMNKELKKQYASQLEQSAPNWVTGVSSPWIDSYKIIQTAKTGKNSYVIELLFSTLTSAGSAGDYKAVLTVKPEEGFWRIYKITADPELYPYTRYQP